MSERINDEIDGGIGIKNVFVRRSEVLDVFIAINSALKDAKEGKPNSCSVPCIPDLPEDATIRTCYYDVSRDGFLFQIVSREYEEVSPWEVPPMVVPDVDSMTRQIWITDPNRQVKDTTHA